MRRELALLGMLTESLLAKRRFGGDPHAARHLLSALSRSGEVHRHICLIERGSPAFAYYTLEKRALGLAALRRSYAIAAWATSLPSGERLLSRVETDALLVPLCQQAGILSCPAATCGISVDDLGPSFTLVRVLEVEDLNAMLCRIQRWTASSGFELWWWLLLAKRLRIVLLCPGSRRAEELARWIECHPVVAMRGDNARVVPLSVAKAPRIRP